jgi:cold shock CspA family protein
MITSWRSEIPGKRGRPTKGRVTQLSHGRLCGVIQAADGQEVFFHSRDLDRVKYNDVEVGDSASFELIDDPISGARAASVQVAAASARAKRSEPD